MHASDHLHFAGHVGIRFLATVALGWCLASTAHAEVFPPTSQSGGFFGSAVSASGSLIAIGEPNLSDFGIGEVHVFSASGSNEWAHLDTFTGSDTLPNDRFGLSVAIKNGENIDGQYLIAAGAPGHADGRGAVYLFRGDGTGFTQIAKLEKPDGQAGDTFGQAMAFSDDRRFLAISAPTDNPADCTKCGPGQGPGSVSVFAVTASGDWEFVADVTTSLPGLGASDIGNSIAFTTSLDGTATPELVVGASATMVDGAMVGRAFVFQGIGPTIWALRETILPQSVGVNARRFGASISVSSNGRTMAIGAPLTTAPGTGSTGTVFIYERTGEPGELWSGTGILFAPTGSKPTVNMGEFVQFISNELLVTSTDLLELTVYRGRNNFQAFTVPTYLGIDPGFFFGGASSFDGGLAIGVPSASRDGLLGAGTVLLFDVGLGKFGSLDPAPAAGFGTAVALNGTIAIVGQPEPNDSTMPGSRSGMVDIVKRNVLTGTWKTMASIPSPLPLVDGADPFHRFGSSIALPTTTLGVVGAPTWSRTSGGKPLSKCGGVALVIGSTNGNFWNGGGMLPYPPGLESDRDEQVGASVAAVKSGTQVFIAAGGPGYFGNQAGNGRVHVWRGPATGNAAQFVHLQVLLPNVPQADARFGTAVAMEAYSDGTIDLWIGAPQEDVPGPFPGVTITDGGSIHLFRKSPASNVFVAQNQGVRHAGLSNGARYGSSLALKSGMLAVGAPTASNSGVAGGGRVYGWRRNTGNWSTLANPVVGALNADARLGASLANTGKEILAGEPGATIATFGSSGRVRRLKFTSTGFSQVSIETYPFNRSGDRFGSAVAIGTGAGALPVVIGSPGNDHGDILDAGMAIGFATQPDACISDVDFDFTVGPIDLSIVIAEWGPHELGRSMADINDDGEVNGIDLAMVLSSWEACVDG